ncbi:MAG: hypothetical protein GMKNLPBB_00917 [Myxococcota bacterium]|nr:hypothetical protein [Myxococcota bacterium]
MAHGRPVLNWIEIDHSPARIRRTGLELLGGLGLLALFLGPWKGRWLAAGLCLAAGAACAIAARLAPRVFHPVHAAVSAINQLIGGLLARLLLLITWFLVMWPIGLWMKLSGQDPMGVRPAPPGASYWKTVKPRPLGDRHIERQY